MASEYRAVQLVLVRPFITTSSFRSMASPPQVGDVSSTANELKRAGVTALLRNSRRPVVNANPDSEELLARTDPDFYERLVRGRSPPNPSL